LPSWLTEENAKTLSTAPCMKGVQLDLACRHCKRTQKSAVQAAAEAESEAAAKRKAQDEAAKAHAGAEHEGAGADAGAGGGNVLGQQQ
jgi:hypothetical protein